MLVVDTLTRTNDDVLLSKVALLVERSCTTSTERIKHRTAVTNTEVAAYPMYEKI